MQQSGRFRFIFRNSRLECTLDGNVQSFCEPKSKRSMHPTSSQLFSWIEPKSSWARCFDNRERKRERVCVVPSLTHRQNFFAPNSFVSQALLWFGFSLRTTDLPMIRFSVVMPPTIWTFTCLLHPTLAQALPRLRGALLRPPDVLRCVTLFEGDRPRQRPRGFGSENRPVDRRFGQGGLP